MSVITDVEQVVVYLLRAEKGSVATFRVWTI